MRRDSIGLVSGRILTLFKTHTGGAQPVTERMTKIMYADIRQAGTISCQGSPGAEDALCWPLFIHRRDFRAYEWQAALPLASQLKIVTDKLRSYDVAHRKLIPEATQQLESERKSFQH